jgi:hypothetical protein
MKCKRIQTMISTNSDLSAAEADHLGACPACRRFVAHLADLDAAVPSLDATAPSHLYSRIQSRLARPGYQLNWRALALATAIVVIITGPVVPIVAKRVFRQYIKGDRIGTLPPFHVKIYGKNHMPLGDETSADLWFSGFAIRTTTPHFDSIDSVEHGISYQHWKPNGVAERRKSQWASTGKPVSPDERKLLLDRLGPVAPAFGEKLGSKQGIVIRVFGREYQTVATTYRLPVSKKGSLTSVENPTDQVVYEDTSTGRIIRIQLISKFPGGISQTETRDYEYVIPSDDKFETATLKQTQTISPAQPTPGNGSPRARAGG